jgi:cadmium resistance protein CadD (predicted permease)
MALAVILFASTDVDDIFVLIAFFADSRLRPAQIVIGQFLGIYALFAASLVLSWAALVIPKEYVGLLGLAPIALGVIKLADLSSEEPSPTIGASFGGVVSIAATTMANGGDNIAAYAPVFATRGGWDIAIVALVFAPMVCLWLALAHWLVNHRAVSALIGRYGHWAVPAALILIGLSILYKAGSFALLSAILR